ncbi:O-antigen ligase family protein [Rurimicrobium arvi]|uniref:O-antigen ligase-related domain-containing protein n=1 Tax=Rurimicrobium arvi TaxID=2049916 RepID=A0ABP8MXJ2_9BACT
MLALLDKNAKTVQLAGIVLLMLCVAVFGFSGNPLFLAVPFGLLFAFLLFFNWKTGFWILLFSVPASIQIWFLGDSLSTSVPDEPIMWLFLLLSVVLIAAKPKIIPEWFWRNGLTMIIVAQYLWLIVSVIYSHVPLLSLKFLAAKTWFLASFFLIPVFIFREKKDWIKAFWLLFIPTTILVTIVFYKHWRLGFSFELIQVAVRYLFYNHVDYSTFLSMIFPVICVAFYLSRGKGLFLRTFFLFLIAFYAAAIHFAYARAAVLAVIFSFTIMAAIRFRLVNWIMPAFYAFIIFIVSYAATNNRYIDYRPDFRNTYMHKSFKEHLIATFKGRDISSMERIYRWIGAVRMSTDEPVKGWGPNSFYFYYKPYTNTSFVTYVSRNPERSTTHNYFLLMLVEQGAPAMLLYALLVFAFFAKAQRVFHRHKDRFYKACTMAVAMVFAASFVNNFFSELIETHKIGSIFYLCISLLIVLDHKSRVSQQKEEPEATAAPPKI